MANAALPDWYTPEVQSVAQPAPAQAAPAPTQAGGAQLPPWYTPEPESVTVTGERAPVDNGAAKNFLTGFLRVPGAIIGTPALLGHTMNWAQAQFNNGLDALTGGHGGHTGAELDKRDPVMGVLPTSEGVDRAVFRATGVTPYEPQSVGGKLGQAATTAAGAGFLDPLADFGVLKQGGSALKSLFQFAKQQAPQAAKTGLAGATAEGTQQVFPNTPGLAAAMALATHAGASGVASAARGGGGVAADAVRQIVQPTKQGEVEAGRVLGQVDNSQPGVATPTAADISTAQSGVRAATDDIGPGLPDWQAGANLRAGLQKRVDGLKTARDDATADLRLDRDTAPALVNLNPVFGLIDNKLKIAAGAQQTALEGARKDLHLSDGSVREDAEQLAATRQAINARISDATRAGDDASAAHLIDVRKTLDSQINSAVPAAGAYTAKYADMSRPLDPMEHGSVGRVLDRDQFNTRYTFPDERIPDLFLRSNATRSDLNQLVQAHGGDKDAAMGALQDHLAGVAQRAVQPDGTLDAAAFDKAMQPYQKSLGGAGMWFPKLAGKFNNAKAAQGTLDTLNAQRNMADAIAGGALRDPTGVVTGSSFGKWLRSNQDALSTTQDPAAVMRLQSMAGVLKNARPGELADVLKSELAPTVLGTMTGGLEGGVLATLLHKTTQTAFGGLDAKRQAAFSAAIEQAATDPAYAARIAAEAAKRGRGLSPTRALVRAIAATPLAVNASAGRGGQ